MIGKPKRDSPTGRALAYIATADGDVSAEIIADHLFPPVVRAVPFTSGADYAAWRKDRTDSDRMRRERASKILRQLTEAGYTEGRGGPRVATWFVAKIEKHGINRALSLASPGLRSIEDGPGVLHARLVIEAETNPPPSVAALIGSKPSGRVTEVWRELCQWGVIVGPSARYLTAKGADLVASWSDV